MKFHRVKLKNLNSLYGEQVIDFEEDVRSSPLFLIIGPTGAGKSTILDAICLALFGQTPRLSRKAGRTDLDVAHIMSLGTSSAYAEADFSVLDNEGGRARYLATWSTRRAYDDPEGAVQKPERSLYRKFDDGTMRLIVADHREKYFQPAFDEALHGLSVDDFKRSILLAQGEFSAFLRAPDAEKASILERLTNTDEYRIIGERAARKRRAVDERQRKLTTRLEEMQILTDAQEAELAASIETCAASVAQRRTELETARKKVEWLRRRDELREHCTVAQESHASILARRQNREDDYRRLHRDAELVEAEPSWSEVRRQTGLLADLDEKLGPLAGQIAGFETKATDADAAIEKATATLEHARTELREREPEIRRSYQLRTRREGAARELEHASKELGTRRGALERLESLRKETLEKMAPARELATRAAERLESLKVSRPLLQRLAPLRASYVDGIAPLEARIAELSAEIEGTAKRVAEIDGERASFDDAIAEAKRERGKWQGQVTRYKNRLDELTRDWKSLEVAVERLSTDNQSASARAEALREARFLLQRISESERERDEVFARVEATEREVKALAEEEEQLKELETSRRAYVRQCEESLRLNERLIALSSYRRDLHGGEPCPLCGSPIHPYCDSDELEQVDRKAQEDRDRLAVELETAREELRATNEKVQRLAGKFVSRKTALRHDEGRLVAVKQSLEKSQAAFADASGRAGYSPLETFQLKSASRVEEELEEAEQLAKTSRAQLDDIETARHQLARAEERLEEADRARREVEDKVGALAEERRQLGDRIRTRTADLDAVRADRTRREGAIRKELTELGVEVDEATGIEVALSRADARLEELVAAGSHAENASKTVTELELALQRQDEKLEEAREAVEQAVRAVEARQKSLDELDAEIAACLDGEDPEKVKERLEAAVKSARDALDAQTQARAATAEKLSAARARQADLAERRERAGAALSEAEENLRVVLGALGIAREEVEAHLLDPEERKKLRVELTALDGELARAATRVQDADQRLARHLETHAGEPPALRTQAGEPPALHTRAGEPPALHALDQAIEIAEACEEQLNQATLELGGLRERWGKHETTKARRVELEAEIREVQHEVDVWGTLYGLIGVRDGERFKLYAQSLNLQGLVDRANHRLEKLHPRYRLCVQHGEGGEPTLTFGVVDRYQANIERPLTTLSGGETFLVSLALALGLADFRQVDMPVETLLLDEGFGTLDQDSLHMALTTLHQLHYDASRQIGIISHVDALKELIDSRIVVEPVGHGRSQIRFEFGAQKNAPPLVLQR